MGKNIIIIIDPEGQVLSPKQTCERLSSTKKKYDGYSIRRDEEFDTEEFRIETIGAGQDCGEIHLPDGWSFIVTNVQDFKFTGQNIPSTQTPYS